MRNEARACSEVELGADVRRSSLWTFWTGI